MPESEDEPWRLRTGTVQVQGVVGAGAVVRGSLMKSRSSSEVKSGEKDCTARISAALVVSEFVIEKYPYPAEHLHGQEQTSLYIVASLIKPLFTKTLKTFCLLFPFCE